MREATNASSRKVARAVAIAAFFRYDIIPRPFTASVEGGVYLKYEDATTGMAIAIEVDNDLDIVALVTDQTGRGAIQSFDMDGYDIPAWVVEVFSGESSL